MLRTRPRQDPEAMFELGHTMGVEATVDCAKQLCLQQLRYLPMYLVPGDVAAVSSTLLDIVDQLTKFQEYNT